MEKSRMLEEELKKVKEKFVQEKGWFVPSLHEKYLVEKKPA